MQRKTVSGYRLCLLHNYLILAVEIDISQHDLHALKTQQRQFEQREVQAKQQQPKLISQTDYCPISYTIYLLCLNLSKSGGNYITLSSSNNILKEVSFKKSLKFSRKILKIWLRSRCLTEEFSSHA